MRAARDHSFDRIWLRVAGYRMLTIVISARFALIRLSCFAAFASASAACDAKESAPAAPVPAVSAPASAPASEPAPAAVPVPAPVVPVSASEAERALAKAFIEKFLTAIEANDADAWPALHTKARRDALIANGAVDVSYEAWHKGTVTVVSHIREADFTLQRSGEDFTLRFVGVKVPTDPETEYSMTVAVEDGEMRISEK